MLGRPRESRGVFKLNLSKSSSAIASSSSLSRSSSSSPAHNRVYKEKTSTSLENGEKKTFNKSHLGIVLDIYLVGDVVCDSLEISYSYHIASLLC